MRKEEARTYVKEQLESYLSAKGINTQKPFHCINPKHPDRNPSMSFDRKRNKAHCFACHADYDMFDIIGIDFVLSDHREIFEKAYGVFGVTVDGQSQAKAERATHARIEKECIKQESVSDYTQYYLECVSRIGETDYLKQRGISDEVARRFRIGFDSHYTKVAGGGAWRALIIPTGKDSYVVRNTDRNADKKNRYRKQGRSLLFNSKALQASNKPVFIVEGELDALSVATVGGEAMALGSTANARAFVKFVESRKPVQPLILALDNDKNGKATAEEIAAELQKQNISYYRINPYGGHKDANDALIADPEGFALAVSNAERIEDEARRAEREAYLQNSAASHLQSFIDGIAESVNTPYIPTGFTKLDAVLDGGLYEGLYIFGAISSLGKTTLIAQIADQIAMEGTDVLIFSLEMARNEMMAKSVSRHTLMTVIADKGEVRNAKTGRGITTGKRYVRYNETERALIQRAIKAYGEYAGHIFISEGIGDIGVGKIRETVEKHVRFTGKKPVVIVDYLQILAPYSERATDKQNTDKAVIELKRISRDYKIPVIGISSFNRANYKEAVTMEAYKESGAIEYSSDVLVGLQLKGAGAKEFNATEQKKKNPREVELVILKNRNGAIGDKIAYDYYPLFNYWKEA